MVYDVIIIGAGVAGAFTARVLSARKLDICIVERESDVATGASSANSAIIHAGYDPECGSLKARLNLLGNRMMEDVCRELDVPFKRTGSLVLAFHEEDLPGLRELVQRGRKNGVEGLEIVDRRRLGQMEPRVSGEAVAALYAPSAGIVCPYELTLAAVENAVENGAELRLETEVKGLAFKNNLFTLATNRGEMSCKYLVNAAGVYADAVAAMAGDTSFSIKPRKGEYILLDKTQGGMVRSVIFQLPSKWGKGILVTPTVDGNLLIGPSATEQESREDTEVTAEGLEQIVRDALKSVPGINLREAVTSFAGLRASPSTGDFIIGASPANGRFINVAGIESPGLTAAPAIGEYAAAALKASGLEMPEKDGVKRSRRGIKRFRDLKSRELNEIIKKQPCYGNIVCRCERVTEGEVVACINRAVGAGNLDAVKRRTRAGMGRCQGGFCTPKVAQILSRELGIPLEEVTKMGGASRLLAGKIK